MTYAVIVAFGADAPRVADTYRERAAADRRVAREREHARAWKGLRVRWAVEPREDAP